MLSVVLICILINFFVFLVSLLGLLYSKFKRLLAKCLSLLTPLVQMTKLRFLRPKPHKDELPIEPVFISS